MEWNVEKKGSWHFCQSWHFCFNFEGKKWNRWSQRVWFCRSFLIITTSFISCLSIHVHGVWIPMKTISNSPPTPFSLDNRHLVSFWLWSVNHCLLLWTSRRGVEERERERELLEKRLPGLTVYSSVKIYLTARDSHCSLLRDNHHQEHHHHSLPPPSCYP